MKTRDLHVGEKGGTGEPVESCVLRKDRNVLRHIRTVPMRTVPNRTVPMRTVSMRAVPMRTVPMKTVAVHSVLQLILGYGQVACIYSGKS